MDNCSGIETEVLKPRLSLRLDDRPPAAKTAATAQLYNNPGQPAVEFPMYRDGLYARADALIPSPTGGYILRETKSSTFPLKQDGVTPNKPKEHHLDDLAIQAWVYQATAWPLAGAELNLLNNQWRYPGNGDYSGLFRQLPVTADVLARISDVPEWYAGAQNMLAGAMPETQTGGHCSKPYDCPFHDHCTTLDAPAPEHPITLLPGPGKRLAKKLNEQRGYTSLLEPQPSEFTGADAALYCRMQIAHRTGQPVLEPGSAAPFAVLPYPRYYFDFEGIDLPVPRWAGVRPYEQIPFQWSCHIERAPGAQQSCPKGHRAELASADPGLPDDAAREPRIRNVLLNLPRQPSSFDRLRGPVPRHDRRGIGPSARSRQGGTQAQCRRGHIGA